MLLQENVSLAPLTTFSIGGPARFLVEAKSRAEVEEAVALAQQRDLPLFILGGGSNLLISDSGWPGLVLKIGITGIERRSGTDEGRVLFDVGAGESWERFVSHAVMAECAGVECLSGIPGSVGGTPVQNVGAYGQEVAETIESVEVFDRRDGKVRKLCKEACGFSYRSSTSIPVNAIGSSFFESLTRSRRAAIRMSNTPICGDILRDAIRGRT